MLGPFPQGLPWAHKPCPRVQTHPKSGMFPLQPCNRTLPPPLQNYLRAYSLRSGIPIWNFSKIKAIGQFGRGLASGFSLPFTFTTISNTSESSSGTPRSLTLHWGEGGIFRKSPAVLCVPPKSEALPPALPTQNRGPSTLHFHTAQCLCYFYRSW